MLEFARHMLAARTKTIGHAEFLSLCSITLATAFVLRLTHAEPCESRKDVHAAIASYLGPLGAVAFSP